MPRKPVRRSRHTVALLTALVVPAYGVSGSDSTKLAVLAGT